MGLAFVPLIANQKIKSMNVMKLMVIEQSNMEAKRFTGYSYEMQVCKSQIITYMYIQHGW